MNGRTIRAWAVLVPAILVLCALATPHAWLTAVAEGSVLVSVALLVVLAGLRERGMPRRGR
jgi:hypothetical protein